MQVVRYPTKSLATSDNGVLLRCSALIAVEPRVTGSYVPEARVMYRVGRAKATELDVPFNWQLQVVPGAGHVNQQMTGAAAALVK